MKPIKIDHKKITELSKDLCPTEIYLYLCLHFFLDKKEYKKVSFFDISNLTYLSNATCHKYIQKFESIKLIAIKRGKTNRVATQYKLL